MKLVGFELVLVLLITLGIFQIRENNKLCEERLAGLAQQSREIEEIGKINKKNMKEVSNAQKGLEHELKKTRM